MKVLYTAAHAGAPLHVPIGGGGAIARMLEEHWRSSQPFELEIVNPDETAEQIVRFTQKQYTRFCYRFERFTTNRILREDPAQCVVLVNDISEGPDFALLARHGYRVYTIWHVDVLAFVARMYLKDVVSPPALAKITRPFENWFRGAPRLVFAKQRQCVVHSAGHFVMTEAMKRTILDCNPGVEPSKIHVVPWGVSQQPGAGVRTECREPVVLTLSRISPEKGQHRLLEAMQGYGGNVRIRIAGDAAFMGGEEYLRRLGALASKLDGPRVEFLGHLSGQAKLNAFASADLYVFPSVSESYGLTLMEALWHGLPVVAWDHDGARAIVEPGFGVLVSSVDGLRRAVADLLADPGRRESMSRAARRYAEARPFSAAADRLASTLLGR